MQLHFTLNDTVSYIICITVSILEVVPDSNLVMCIYVNAEKTIQQMQQTPWSTVRPFLAGLACYPACCLPLGRGGKAGIVPRSWMKGCLSPEAPHGVHDPMTAEIVYVNQWVKFALSLFT